MVSLKGKVVLHILPALKQGGVEHSVVNLALSQQKSGLVPVVVSQGGAMVSKLEAVGVKHVLFPAATKNPIKILCNVSRLKKLFKELDVSLVHAHSRAPAWSAYLAAKKLGIPYLTTYHGVYGHKSRFKRWYNSAMLKGQFVIVPSTYVKEHIVSIYSIDASKVIVVPHGLDISNFMKVSKSDVQDFVKRFKIPSDKPVISIVGRLTRLKGHRVLFDALAQLKQDFVCVVAGPARKEEDLDDLKMQLKRLKLSKKVIFTGSVDGRLVYANSDILVSASIQPETFGLTMLEAHAFGVPVVATAHGGATEIVLDGVTGLWVEPKDADDLARGLSIMLSLSPAEMKKMKEASKKRALEFDLNESVKATLKVYQNML